MFFHSECVHTHWDTWLYYENETYYLYYLSEWDGCWRGFGVATSKDGATFQDHGLALAASENMVNFFGTGSIRKKKGEDHTYLVNYSEWQVVDGTVKQRIFFAESKDLIHFKKCEGVVFDIDERFYEPVGRWD